MPFDAEDLWPDDLLSLSIKSPKRILGDQVRFLNLRGGSVVQAEVKTQTSRSTTHEFWLLCNMLSSRVLLFRVQHAPERVYPSHVNCIMWEDENAPSSEEDWRIASSEQELKSLIKDILTSPFVRSVVDSMQAQAADHIDSLSEEERAK